MYVCMYVYVYVYVYVRQSRNRSFHGRVHRLPTSCFRRELVTNRIRSFFQRISTCLCGKLVPHGFSMICNSMNESFSLSLSFSLLESMRRPWIFRPYSLSPFSLSLLLSDSLLLCPLRNKFFTLYFSVNSSRRLIHVRCFNIVFH